MIAMAPISVPIAAAAAAAAAMASGVYGVQHWLSCVGSPSSRIERCNILEEGPIEQCSFTTFDRRPSVP
jgi:hypothetical protein